MKKKNHKKHWEELIDAWKKIDSPARPDKETCLILFKHMVQHLKKVKGETRILILGCTPEYRDISYVCSRIFNSKVLCVDNSDYIYKAMSQLIVFHNKNEKFIHANWTKIPINPSSIDIILGDSSIANIPKELRKKFFREMTRIMKKDALFLPRNDTVSKNIPKKIDLEKEFSRQAKRVLNGERTVIDASGYLGDLMVRICGLNNKNNIASIACFKDEFNELYKKYKNKKDIHSKTMFLIIDVCKESYFASIYKEWVIYSNKLFEKELEKYFNIKKIITPKTIDLAECFRIYVMEKKMNLKKYSLVYKKQICPYPVLLVAPAYHVFQRKYLNYHLNKAFLIIDDGMWKGYVDHENWEKTLEKMFKLYKKKKKIIDNFALKFEKISKEFLKFTKSLTKTNYSKLSNKELLKLYKKYNKEYIESFQYGECPAELLKDFLEKKLKEKLLEIVKDRKKLNRIFSLLTIPTKENFVTREEKNLLKIAINKKKTLSRHTSKYNWVPVDYNGEPWTIKDFEKRLKELDNPKKKLKEIKENLKKLKKEQLKIKNEYKIDNKTFSLCLETQKCMELMDIKKEVYSKAHYHVQFLMKAIAKRLGLNLTQANYLMPDEVERALTKGSFNKKILDKRYKKSAYVSDGFKIYFLSKKEENKIRKFLEEKLKKTNELNGICGNPGYIKGKARVIVKNEDFPKMKKGEILVTAFTTPDFVVIMKKASGIVTDLGGITSHSSIVSRELNIPCVVGTKHATKLIKTGDTLEINAIEGVVKILK